MRAIIQLAVKFLQPVYFFVTLTSDLERKTSFMDRRKLLMITGILIFGFFSLSAQTGINSFCVESKKLNAGGMYVLGGWALANIAWGVYGWANYTGQLRYFSQMNVFWNTVNLAIAGISLNSTGQMDCNVLGLTEVLDRQMKTERTLLVNAGLDVLYIGSGFVLRYFAGKSEKRSTLLRGYGNSIIMQGAFLLVFDLAFRQVLIDHRPLMPDKLGLSITPGMTGFYASFSF